MPRLSWNEIQNRAVEFAARWQGETYEKGESQTFWSEFLTVYGIDRRRHGAFFEYAVKKTGGKQGFIDLFWPGKLLAEQKSAGRDLDAAQVQAYDYLPHNKVGSLNCHEPACGRHFPCDRLARAATAGAQGDV